MLKGIFISISINFQSNLENKTGLYNYDIKWQPTDSIDAQFCAMPSTFITEQSLQQNKGQLLNLNSYCLVSHDMGFQWLSPTENVMFYWDTQDFDY